MRFLKLTLALACLSSLVLFAVSFSRPAQGEALLPESAPVTPSERFADLSRAEDPSFRRDVIPLLARVGCSARECHGSFQGRGGFQLSLFGSEWEADLLQLTQKKGGEDEIRVDLKNPEKSLILLKPTLQMTHKGKLRFKKDSWQYNMILKWIQDGVKDDSTKTGELQRLEIIPPEIVFDKPGQTVQLRAMAHWVDGLVQDVTELTRFKTNDETIATVSDGGLVSSTGKGDSHIIASYDNGVTPIPVMLAVSQFAGSRFPHMTPRTKVDELVLNKLRKVGIVPSEVCTDAEFLRRVSLDLTGTLPTPEEVTRFLSDNSSGKRSAKVEELLQTPAYAAWWATKFCDYTGNNSRQLNLGPQNLRGYGGAARQWYEWFQKRIADNMPYDQIVSNVVLATSRSSPDESYKDYTIEMDSYFRSKNPAEFANHPTMPYFWQRRGVQTADEKALAFAHTFLGVRIECAQCHKHPFDRWTKKDFKQFSAFFSTVAVGNRPAAPGEEVSFTSVNKELKEAAEALYAKSDEGQMANAASPTTAPSDAKDVSLGKEALVKKAIKKDRGLRKYLVDETNRRVEAGEPVPWVEVFPNTSGTRVIGGKNRNKNANNIDPSLQPKVLGGEVAIVPKGVDSRQPLMDWLRSKSNPYFAKSIVNRVWASYFNRGIVDPADDLNIANAPSNTELLSYLADEFVAHHYDLKWLHREIINSDTYQRSWRTNPTNALDQRNFSHAVVRQLPAEVMLDAIEMAIGGKERVNAFASNMEVRAIGPVGATQAAKPGKGGGGGNSDQYFLTLFGKPARLANCDCERSADPTLLQTLFTRNDPALMARIEAGTSWIGELRIAARRAKNEEKLDVDKTVEEIFLRTVSRPPTDQEMTKARADIASASDPVNGVRDLLWAMINTREFKVNH